MTEQKRPSSNTKREYLLLFFCVLLACSLLSLRQQFQWAQSLLDYLVTVSAVASLVGVNAKSLWKLFSKARKTEYLAMRVNLLGLGTLLVFYAILSVRYALADKYPNLGEPSTTITALPYSVLAIPPIVVLLGRKKGLNDLDVRKAKRARLVVLYGISYVIGVVFSVAYRVLMRGQVPAFVKGATPGFIILMILIEPLTVELFFRGYVQGIMLHRFRSATRVIITSLLFASAYLPRVLYHSSVLPNPSSLVAYFSVTSPAVFLAYVFLFSNALGVIYEHTTSSLATSVLHALANFTSIVTLS